MSGVEEVAVILVAVVSITESVKTIVNNVNDVLAGIKQTEGLVMDLFQISTSSDDKKVINAINAAKEEILTAINKLDAAIVVRLKEARIEVLTDRLKVHMDSWSITHIDRIRHGLSGSSLGSMYDTIREYTDDTSELILVLQRGDIPRTSTILAYMTAANGFLVQVTVADWGLRLKEGSTDAATASEGIRQAKFRAHRSITNYQGLYEAVRTEGLRVEVRMNSASWTWVNQIGEPVSPPNPGDGQIRRSMGPDTHEHEPQAMRRIPGGGLVEPPEPVTRIRIPAVVHGFTVVDPYGAENRDGIMPSVSGFNIDAASYDAAYNLETGAGEALVKQDQDKTITYREPTVRGVLATYMKTAPNYQRLLVISRVLE